MRTEDIYDWEDAIGMPTAEDRREFCDKADEFLRRKGHYVGRMRPFHQYGRGKQRKDSAQDENIVVSNQQRG